MINLKLSDLITQLSDVTLTQDAEFHGISIDTRTLTKNNLYIAIKGERYDGHDFIQEATHKGASALVVNRPIDSPLPQLLVKDTLLTFGRISKYWRDQFQIPFIGVTGSNGKTTLKNMIASILKVACDNETQVLATEGNLNNNIGVPLILSRLNDQHRYAVIEMGMNHFHEIDYLTRIVKPSVAVINNAAAAHLEGLSDLAGVAKAKGEIFAGLIDDGTAILNRDDSFYSYWHNLVTQQSQLTFGLDNPADITAKITSQDIITLHTPKGNIEVNLLLLGRHNIMNALAATAATMAIGIDLVAIKTGLENVKPAPGRLRKHTLDNGLTIIDDTYNANPASTTAAIHTLASLGGTRILILGDMKELGFDAKKLHFNIGKEARNAGLDYLFTLGELSQAASEAFGNNAKHFTDRNDLLSSLQPYLTKTVSILVKGSRSMRMESVVSGLIPEHENLTHSHQG